MQLVFPANLYGPTSSTLTAKRQSMANRQSLMAKCCWRIALTATRMLCVCARGSLYASVTASASTRVACHVIPL